MKNWAGTFAYSTKRVLRPASVAEAQELLVGAGPVRPLGARHSFSLVGDSAGALISTERLDRILEIGADTVTVEAGVRLNASMRNAPGTPWRSDGQQASGSTGLASDLHTIA